MLDQKEGARAFDTFRALDNSAEAVERDQLFRNMAQLFSYVSDRCEDSQVEQYDEVLCQLAELVETEARSEVAKLLAPLQRAPGTVVVKLANDEIEVAKPLLEFSNVLSDDDLIEIVKGHSEEHRVAIAGRQSVNDRVGGAIVDHGADESVGRLAENNGAQLENKTLSLMIERASTNEAIATKLRRRAGVNWAEMHSQVSAAGQKILGQLQESQNPADSETIKRASSIAFNRLQNKAGFSGRDWGIAWNQIKALSDRRQLDDRAIERFSKFGYGHHLGAAMTLMLGLKQEVFVKWLATNDYRALALAARTLGLGPELFQHALHILPWRDDCSDAQRADVAATFEQLDPMAAEQEFELWRAHGFRKSKLPEELQSVLGV